MISANLFSAAILLWVVSGSSEAPIRDPASYADDKIYVHLVPHTHDDVGWQKTVDQYYYGGNKTITPNAVKYILDTVIDELQKDEKRTFIYVEIAFFERWWRQQTDDMKNIVKKLVASKQLEFINGGWCMNDEASTHYNAIIDQMTLGLQFIENTFGPEARPRIAWQVDPFGHSNEQASLFASMGFDGLFFGRHDYDDHTQRINEKKLQMVWQPSESLGESADLFTVITTNGYGPPQGFCFDIKCSNDLIQDDPNLYDYNVDKTVDNFIEAIYAEYNISVVNHIMFTFGSDFQYMDARMNFDNMDKLIKYTNMKNSSVEVFYSTPTAYIDALHAANKTWTVKKDDFFPYANNPYSFWTGYFTSRPALKGYEREMNNLLQVCTQIEAMGFGTMKKMSDNTTRYLMEAMGVVQHHDAVSGTEKQHVAYDYAKRLAKGEAECNALIADVLGAHLATKKAAARKMPSSLMAARKMLSSLDVPMIESCSLLNVSACPATETNNFNVIVYNPLGRPAYYAVRVPLTTNKAQVSDSKGNSVPAQISGIPDSVSRVRGKRGNAEYELYFNVVLPPLGYMTYFVREGSGNTSFSSSTAFSETKEVKLSKTQDNVVIQSNNYDVGVDGDTGRLYYINNNDDNGNTLSLKLDQNFLWYKSSDGKNKNSTQASGAYIFRPNGTAPLDINGKDTQSVKINVVKGPLFEEVQQNFSDWIQQSIRVHKEYPFVEFDYIVGPIPVNDHLGKEIISRFTSSVSTNQTWYTDANGREMQKRVRNYRATWKYNNTEPVAGNYYPVNSRIAMQYEDPQAGSSQFTVMTDRSQGGASLNDGQLELMVHRRMLHDDKRGVGEPLNETGLDGRGLIIRGRHYVMLSNVSNSTATHRLMGEALYMKPYLAFVRDSTSPKTWMDKYQTEYTGLKTPLPLNVHLLTLRLMEEGDYKTLLVRLEHQFEADEAPYNQQATVALADLFPFEIVSVDELGLAGNTAAPLSRLQWTTENSGESRRKISTAPVKSPEYNVVLEPMQIRTLTVKVKA